MLEGVDVASFQGSPASWTSVAGDIVWAAVKLTELEPNGTKYVNPDAKADMDWLRTHHKGRIGYLFGHPSVEATATVDFFVTQFNAIGLHDTDAVALDLETTDGLSAQKVAAWAVDVQSQLHKRLDRVPLVYTFIDFAKQGNCAGLGGYPLWIADPSSPRGHPVVPEPWKTWAIHQYATTASIDRDVADYANQSAMFKALGKKPSSEPDVRKIGGNSSAIAATIWPNGRKVVAGIGTDSYVYRTTSSGGAWGEWAKVSPTKAKGTLALTSAGTGDGAIYYIELSGQTVEINTSNYGDTWA
ncbi:MAG TPA: GH25 family lysozyme [Streptosporangiaceae bacterium]|nr:GH25 family lysozyme [Streptosporangiaceae bacterium]